MRAALAHLVELDALHLEGLEPLARDQVAAEEVARGFLREVEVLGVARRHDADASRQERHRGPGLRARPLEDRVQHPVADRAQRVPGAVVVVLEKLLDGDARSAVDVAGDRQLLGVAREVVRGGDDDLVAVPQGELPVDGQCLGVLRCGGVQPRPARSAGRRSSLTAFPEVAVGRALLAEELQRAPVGDGEDLVAEVALHVGVVVGQRMVRVEIVVLDAHVVVRRRQDGNLPGLCGRDGLVRAGLDVGLPDVLGNAAPLGVAQAGDAPAAFLGTAPV